MTDGTRSYQAGNVGDSAIVQQGEHLSLIVNYYQHVAPQVVDQEMLSAASQQLARLPLETLPGITSLPSGSRMPFAPNSSFVGRASNLRMLAASFKDHEDKDDTHVSIVAVTGLGGIGKTQLATEFVHRYGQYFVGGVFWLSFAEASAIPLEVAECGRPGYLNLRSDFHTLSLDDQIRLVLGAWQSSLPRLLVFDNCEEEELLVRWRPPTGASHVLMTSHRAEWDATLRVKVLPLGELQQADSVRLLRSYAPGLQASDADFAAIATELGNLPLALQLAGHYLGKFHRIVTPQAYLLQLRRPDLLDHPSLSSGGISLTNHDQNVGRTFEVSYKNLDHTNPTDTLTLALLARAVYFAPGEPIPHRLLLATLDGVSTSEEALLQAESALIRLLELGLIEWVNEREKTLRLHRLLAMFFQKKITDPNAQTAVERALASCYEQIRSKLSLSAQRTFEMNQLVDRMKGFARQATYTRAEIQRLFDTGAEGNRIAALAILSVLPAPSCFDSIRDAICHSHSAFEQYHALLAAKAMLPGLENEQKSELESILRDKKGNAKYIGPDTSRRMIGNDILAALHHAGKTQKAMPHHAGKTQKAMPNVFKILKDLELKSVGLDPQTNKMPEGYFISFRSAGLPIHKEDFETAWTPLGANLEKDIPKTEPSDPANAPKTGSGQTDENKIFAAHIAQSMQSYLNTFLLTDDKLRMNNQYAVMPDSSKVSDTWWALITGATGIPTQSVPNPDLQKALDAALAKLQDQEGNVTPHYQAYMQYEDEYKSKVRAWHRTYAAAFIDPTKLLQNWPIDGVSYEDDANQAMDRWVGLGFKEEIENALATLAAQGTDPASALIRRAKKRFFNSLNEFQGIGEIPFTFMLPSTWCDSDNDDGWDYYTSIDYLSESDYQASSTSYGGAGGLIVGFWSASASLNHVEQQKPLDMQVEDIEIAFKYCIVDIERPWLDISFLNLKNWFLVGDYKKGCVSDGTMGQHLPDHAAEATFLPSIVTSLILIKDLSIWWSNWKEHWDAHSETKSTSTSVGYGPFSINGSYSYHGELRNFSAETDGETLSIPGIQLIGYVSTINPLAPTVDSPSS